MFPSTARGGTVALNSEMNALLPIGQSPPWSKGEEEVSRTSCKAGSQTEEEMAPKAEMASTNGNGETWDCCVAWDSESKKMRTEEQAEGADETNVGRRQAMRAGGMGLAGRGRRNCGASRQQAPSRRLHVGRGTSRCDSE